MSLAYAPVQAPRKLLGRVHDSLSRPDAKAQTYVAADGVTQHRIRLRAIQSILWGVLIGALTGTCVAAGLYYGFFQIVWHLPIGPLWLRHGITLKHVWDNGMGIPGLTAKNSWYLYRHNERDMMEATLSTLAGHTILAKSKYWDVRLKVWQVILFTPLLLLAAGGLIAGGTWLEYFGMPAAWTHLTPHGYNWDGVFSFAGHLSLENIILGILVGLIVKFAWAPIGATLQGYLLDNSAEKARQKDQVPAWVHRPDAPPVMRERFTMMWLAAKAHAQKIAQAPADAIILHMEPERDTLKRLSYGAIGVFLFLTFVLGAIAKFWIAHGHTVPWLG